MHEVRVIERSRDNFNLLFLICVKNQNKVFVLLKNSILHSGDPVVRITFCVLVIMAHENAVSLKLPTFWTSQPHVWFAQTEAQFHLRSITNEDTMYFHVLAALDQSTATRLLDLINKPPATGKYTAIKKRLLETFGLSKQVRATRLLHLRPLGDSKPSVLMDEMLALLGDHPPCFLFHQLFLERLPEDIRIQLADCELDDCRLLARKANALWSSRDIGPDTNAVISHQRNRKGRDTEHSRPAKDTLCYFHKKFGSAARQCREPCSWAGNEQAGRH